MHREDVVQPTSTAKVWYAAPQKGKDLYSNIIIKPK
jgi:hypothetical protein